MNHTRKLKKRVKHRRRTRNQRGGLFGSGRTNLMKAAYDGDLRKVKDAIQGWETETASWAIKPTTKMGYVRWKSPGGHSAIYFATLANKGGILPHFKSCRSSRLPTINVDYAADHASIMNHFNKTEGFTKDRKEIIDLLLFYYKEGKYYNTAVDFCEGVIQPDNINETLENLYTIQ